MKKWYPSIFTFFLTQWSEMCVDGKNTIPTVRSAQKKGNILSRSKVIRNLQNCRPTVSWVVKFAYLANIFHCYSIKWIKYSISRTISIFEVEFLYISVLNFWRSSANIHEYVGKKDINRQVATLLQQYLQSFTEFVKRWQNKEEIPDMAICE